MGGGTEEKASRKRGILRLLVGYQAFYYLPVLILEGLGIQAVSNQYLIGTRNAREYLSDFSLMMLHFVVYFGLLFYALTPWQVLAFAVVHQGEALFGLHYGLVFSPNHKGMLILDKDKPLDFVSTWARTTGNVKPNFLVDLMYGGLNYQIEHHLFTMMPRKSLRKARPIVKEFCRQQGIPYYETGTLKSYREILSHMHQASSILRKGSKPPAKIEGGNPPTVNSGVTATGQDRSTIPLERTVLVIVLLGVPRT